MCNLFWPCMGNAIKIQILPKIHFLRALSRQRGTSSHAAAGDGSGDGGGGGVVDEKV